MSDIQTKLQDHQGDSCRHENGKSKWKSVIGDLYLTIVLHVCESMLSMINSHTVLNNTVNGKLLQNDYIYPKHGLFPGGENNGCWFIFLFFRCQANQMTPPHPQISEENWTIIPRLILLFCHQAYHVPGLTVPRPLQSTELACRRRPQSPTPRLLIAASSATQWSPKLQARVQL